MDFFDFSDYFLKHTEDRTFQGECCCRMAAYFAQRGLCYITGRPLEHGYRQMHHRKRRHYGGPDSAENTILLNKAVHLIVHSNDSVEISRLCEEIRPTEAQFHLINQLRRESHMKVLRPVTVRIAA